MATKRKTTKRRKRTFFLRVGIVAILVYLLVFLAQLRTELRDAKNNSDKLTQQIKAQQILKEGLISQNRDYQQTLEEKAHDAGYARSGEYVFYVGPTK